MRNPMGTGVCETCAERGRPNEPVYKMGMCESCYTGLRHPKATREQLAKETGREGTRISASAPQKRRLSQEDFSVRDRVNYPNPTNWQNRISKHAATRRSSGSS